MTCDKTGCNPHRTQDVPSPAANPDQAAAPWLTAAYEKATMYTFSETESSWNARSVVVRIEATPFAEGSFRYCHKMRLRDPEDAQDEGAAMVLKVFKEAKSPDAYFTEAMAQNLASGYARAFNERSERKISFLPVNVMKLHERGDSFVTAEPFLPGKYVKHNDNDGHVDTGDALPQAFSHFTWAASKRQLLVVDIQGCGNVYTDPSVQSMNGDDKKSFGASNCGRRAIQRFFGSHICTAHCRAHKLPDAEEELLALAQVHDACKPISAKTLVPSPKQQARKERAALKAATYKIPQYPMFLPQDINKVQSCKASMPHARAMCAPRIS